MFKKLLLGLFTTLIVNLTVVTHTYAQAQDDILDFLPAIVSGIDPPPPRPAQWRITNATICISMRSTWRVDDGENERIASVNSSNLFTPPAVSSIVEVPPGNRKFEWSLRTENSFFTCGDFDGEFTSDLRPGFRYEFELVPNGSGGVRVNRESSRYQ